MRSSAGAIDPDHGYQYATNRANAYAAVHSDYAEGVDPMPKISFSLEHALRYLFPGLMVYTLITLFDRNFSDFNVFDKSIVSLAIGLLWYAFYRAVIYDFFILFLLERLGRGLGWTTQRTFLSKRYVLTTFDIDDLYFVLRTKDKVLTSEMMSQRSALIHFTYQASFIALLGLGFCLFSSRCSIWDSIGFAVAFGLLMFAALFADLRLECQIGTLLKQSVEDIDITAAACGYKKRNP